MFFAFLSFSYFIQQSALAFSGVNGSWGGGAGAAALCCGGGAAGERSAELLPPAQADSASIPQRKMSRSGAIMLPS